MNFDTFGAWEARKNFAVLSDVRKVIDFQEFKKKKRRTLQQTLKGVLFISLLALTAKEDSVKCLSTNRESLQTKKRFKISKRFAFVTGWSGSLVAHDGNRRARKWVVDSLVVAVGRRRIFAKTQHTSPKISGKWRLHVFVLLVQKAFINVSCHVTRKKSTVPSKHDFVLYL